MDRTIDCSGIHCKSRRVLAAEADSSRTIAAAGRDHSSPLSSRIIAVQPTRKGLVESWAGVDRALFEVLREWRRRSASERAVPAYLICGDVTLRDLARRRPKSISELASIHGLGEKKIADFGTDLTQIILDYRVGHVQSAPQAPSHSSHHVSANNRVYNEACKLFSERQTLATIASQLDRAPSTIFQYLIQFMEENQIIDPSPWLEEDEVATIEVAYREAGGGRLKPVFEALEGRYSYEKIRIAIMALRNRQTLPTLSDESTETE